MKWEKVITKNPRAFYKEYLKASGKAGGYFAAGVLHKAHINQDFIYLEGRRSRRKGEKEDSFGLSLNDYEAIAFASMLTWCVAKRMKTPNMRRSRS